MYAPKKELGQNFLIDRQIPRRMVDALNLDPDDIVVEIGPGLGVVTREICDRHVSGDLLIYAVEIDVRFVEKLETMFLENLRVNIVERNILDWLPEFSPEKPFKLIGSLPYYITSPIIHEVIKMPVRPLTAVLLIQKEVAEKIVAKAPDSSYMSVFVQTFYNVSYLETVTRNKFKPEPKVDGGVIKLMLKEDPGISSEFINKYEGFLHKGFSNPRKMLNKVFNKEELEKIGVEGNLRPQNIDASKWIEAFKLLTS